jgi:group II intron reverse transcriptase/maturase
MTTERKAHSLIDKIYNWNNLWTAWRKVRANKGAPGVDRVTIQDFESQVELHLRELQRKLMQDRYAPKAVRRTYIPKASDPTKLRPLGIPSIMDRICQQAIVQVLAPVFDRDFSDRSYAYRHGRSAKQAMATLIEDIQAGNHSVLDADIEGFFDNLDHNVIMTRVCRKVADGRVLRLIEAFLKAPIRDDDGNVSIPTVGTPQGGVISPLLANIVLDDLDKAIEQQGWRHVRYADDFVIVTKSNKEAGRAHTHIQYILDELRLKLHQDKTRIGTVGAGFTFLGFNIKNGMVAIRDKALETLKDKIRLLTRRKQGCNVDTVISNLNPVLRGWAGYYGGAQVATVFCKLDKWIRMRIRAFRFGCKRATDNGRLPNRILGRWGLLSLSNLRPSHRLSFRRAGVSRASSTSLAMGQRLGVAQMR